MTFLEKPRSFSKSEFRSYIDTLTWTTWKPKFIVLHNSASPNLKQWTSGTTTTNQRLINLIHYYKNDLHWHSGPHLFIGPDKISEICNLTQDGVHASCFNKLSVGIEMIGDYGSESFTDGPGALVRDNSIYTLAVLHKKLGLTPDKYIYKKQGLHFHKECVADHHDCPGKNVIKNDIVNAVLLEISKL
jgi:hypothetical protein